MQLNRALFRRMFLILFSKVISVRKCHSAHNTEVTLKTGLYFKQDTTMHNVIWSQKTETKGGKHEAQFACTVVFKSNLYDTALHCHPLAVNCQNPKFLSFITVTF